MSNSIKFIGFCMFLALAACDDSSTSISIDTPEESRADKPSNTAVYFPDGGGVEFSKPFTVEKEGPGWKYKEFTLENDWAALSSALRETMKQQGYEELGKVDLQGFENSLSFAKKGSSKKVVYRVKMIKTLAGDKLMLRLSWNV